MFPSNFGTFQFDIFTFKENLNFPWKIRNVHMVFFQIIIFPEKNKSFLLIFPPSLLSSSSIANSLCGRQNKFSLKYFLKLFSDNFLSPAFWHFSQKRVTKRDPSNLSLRTSHDTRRNRSYSTNDARLSELSEADENYTLSRSEF